MDTSMNIVANRIDNTFARKCSREKIRLFRNITAKTEMSKFRSTSSSNVIFANNLLRKKKEARSSVSNGPLQMVSYIYSGLLNPYEPRPLQRRLTVPIVILALEEENQVAIISCSISSRISKQRYYIDRRF